MNARFAIMVLATLTTCLACGPRPAAAQARLGVEPQGSFNVSLAPLNDPNNVNAPGLFGNGVAPVGAGGAGAIKADIGFDYIVPIFNERSVSLVVPGVAGAFVGLANFSNDFAFMPRFNVEYQFGDLGFGVGASGKILQVSGRVHRNIDMTAGPDATADAEATVDVAVANVIEAVKPIDLGSTDCFCNTPLEDTLLTLTLGGRYAYVHQTFSSSLNLGDRQTSLTANQQFTGFGVTSSMTWLGPLFGEFAWYTSVRGSLLVGTNQRTSVLTIVAPPGGISNGITVTENRTLLMPAAEWEVGVAYGMELARNHAAAPPALAPLLWFRTGLVGQFWNQAGLLEIVNNSGNQFSDSNLLLLGFTIQVGLDY